jgi:hypothetical protein
MLEAAPELLIPGDRQHSCQAAAFSTRRQLCYTLMVEDSGGGCKALQAQKRLEDKYILRDFQHCPLRISHAIHIPSEAVASKCFTKFAAAARPHLNASRGASPAAPPLLLPQCAIYCIFDLQLLHIRTTPPQQPRRAAAAPAAVRHPRHPRHVLRLRGVPYQPPPVRRGPRLCRGAPPQPLILVPCEPSAQTALRTGGCTNSFARAGPGPNRLPGTAARQCQQP